MCQLLSINKTLTSTYHPEHNGQVENLHKTLRSMLKARVEDNPATWDEHLDFCVMASRISVSVGGRGGPRGTTCSSSCSVER